MAAILRNVLLPSARKTSILKAFHRIDVTAVRGRKRWERAFLKDLYDRRIAQGPEPERPRSFWMNWNYDAEIFAFGKRLGEDFKEETLRTAFTDKSYLEKEEAQRAELGLEGEDATMTLPHNGDLATTGTALSTTYIKGYLRHCLPYLPEEGVSAITAYLMSEELLSYVAENLGLRDLILCKDFPVPTNTLCQAFKAVIGGLSHDQGVDRAQQFVQDFLCTQLLDKDLLELWTINNPMGVLTDILNNQDQAEPEPRLLWETGRSTMEAAYMVGIYSNKKLIGKAPGETVTIAEEMAARDALRNLFGMTWNKTPFKYGKEGRNTQIDTEKLHVHLKDFKREYLH